MIAVMRLIFHTSDRLKLLRVSENGSLVRTAIKFIEECKKLLKIALQVVLKSVRITFSIYCVCAQYCNAVQKKLTKFNNSRLFSLDANVTCAHGL